LKTYKSITQAMSNAQEHVANTVFLVNMLLSLKDGGVFVWKDTGFMYKREGKKLVCNEKALKKMTKITGGRASSILKLECMS